MSVFIQSRSVKLVFKAIHKEQHYKFSPIPPGGGGAQRARTTFNFLPVFGIFLRFFRRVPRIYPSF